jgi:hypothetical protein
LRPDGSEAISVTYGSGAKPCCSVRQRAGPRAGTIRQNIWVTGAATALPAPTAGVLPGTSIRKAAPSRRCGWCNRHRVECTRRGRGE